MGRKYSRRYRQKFTNYKLNVKGQIKSSLERKRLWKIQKYGEYGRTNYGKIIKFAWLECSNGKRDESKVLLINEEILSNNFYYFHKGEKIVKHSKQLIDLIKSGDIVNGHLVIDKYEDVDEYGNNFWCLIIEDDSLLNRSIREEDIKTILTKEQSEVNCYKVGGEDEQRNKVQRENDTRK